jgi:hypothetical protein
MSQAARNRSGPIAPVSNGLINIPSGRKPPVEGRRFEVNPSVDRYKREMANLSAEL